MIRTEHIKRRYRDLQVLKGIDMEIGEGEIISIVGASGAGKTTLLQILGTLDQADEGQLYFKDQVIGSKNKADLIHAPWYKRLLGWIIDRVVMEGMVTAIAFLIWNDFLPPVLPGDSLLVPILMVVGISIGVLLMYYVALEGLFGKTVGKMIMKTRVIDRYGKKPTTGALIGRTLARLIPFEAFSFISRVPQNGLHDGVSNTIVINDAARNADGNYSYGQLGEDGLSRFRNEELGFVFQFHHLLPEFNALENVSLPGFVMGRKRSEVEARAKELLTFLGLADRMHHKPNELSGGEQQRVAVARALINNPAIILADEPSGNLDSASAKELHQLFFDLRDKYNQTFIIVTHNNELADMADRKLVMKDGVILSDGKPNRAPAA